MLKFPLTLILRRNAFSSKILQIRTLYSPAALGIDSYIQTCDKVKNEFINHNLKFREKMEKFLVDSKNIIFTEDLKNMVHLASNKDDIDLVVKMIQKFNAQAKELRYGTYVFGPVVMRMFYHLGDVETALKCFKDKNLEGFFYQVTSAQILMDMLYENKRYQEVIEIFEIIKSHTDTQNINYHKKVIVLIFAAYYKMNTPEALEDCMKLWNELNKTGNIPTRKTATLAAGLALKQNAPHIALEIVSTLKDQQYFTVRNIKIQAYADLNRPEDGLPVLRSILEMDEPISTKKTFIRDALNKLKESIQRNGKKEIETEFKRIEKFLADNGHISEQSMDEILCSQIDFLSPNKPKRAQSYIAASFSRDNNYQNQTLRRRKSLQDMY